MKKTNKEQKKAMKINSISSTPTTTDLNLKIMELNNQIDLMIKYHEKSNSGNEGFAEGLKYAKGLIKDKLT